MAAAGGLFAAEDPAHELARRIDARQRRVTDLRARFVQTYRSGVLGRELVESGTVALKRPGRMRWEYREPERKTFVSDGQRIYFYVPADKQVVVREQAGEQGLTARLLSGQGDLLTQFDAALEAGAEPGLQRLRLTPLRPDADLERVLLDVAPDGRITGLEIFDLQGNRSRFRFLDLRENVGLAEGEFRFETPKGVELVAG